MNTNQSPAEVHGELSDAQIDALMPDADGSAEVNKVYIGRGDYEYDEVDAWSRPLVRQVVRAALASNVQPKGTEAETVPWPKVSRYSGGASADGVAGRVWLMLGDGPGETEYVRASQAPAPGPDAFDYAKRLATSMWQKHYKADAPDWGPCDSLLGVLTQIDNMLTGLTRTPSPAVVDGVAVPEGYKLAPHYRGYARLGTGQYAINHSAAPADPELGAELIISIATDEDKAGNRQIGEKRDTPANAGPIQPEDMAVRIGFLSERALFALEDQLIELRKEHFPGTCPAAIQMVEPSEPLTEERATQGYAKSELWGATAHACFEAGVRFAERAHGIVPKG